MPTCHSEYGCPVDNKIPEFNALVANDQVFRRGRKEREGERQFFFFSLSYFQKKKKK